MFRNAISDETIDEYFKFHNDGAVEWKKRSNSKVAAGSMAGSLRPDGYYAVQLKGHRFLLHQLIYYFHHKCEPINIDHIDQNKTNNRISNLRSATVSQNGANRGLPINNSSGYKGVNKKGNYWQVNIKYKGKQIHGGVFKDKHSAAKHYNAEMLRLFGEFAYLNIIEE